jgi:hypothetical protein
MKATAVRVVGACGAALGVALFVWSLRAAGVGAVLQAVERLGFGFLVLVALGGVRHLVRAAAWRLCFEDPRELSIARSVAAYVSGDAVGNVTPFGVFASEPSKIVLLRDRLDSAKAIPALALENLFYGGTVIAMLIAGTCALLIAFNVTARIRATGMVVVAASVAAVLAAIVVAKLRPRLATPLLDFVSRRRGRVWAVGALETAYHVSAVTEIWVALALVTGEPPSVLTAFVLEYVNRAITIVFQFVPMWLGVDEAGTGLMTAALGLTGATGVALALARKARVAVWTAVGLGLLGTFRRSPAAGLSAERVRSTSARQA